MELGLWDEIRDRLNLSALGKPALIGLAALIILVAVFAGKNIVDTATASDFEVVRAEGSAVSASSEAAPSSIFVHISGAVKKPGLVELDSGARVADAVSKAGGFSKDAAIDSVNLARVLVDGEQVFVSTTSPGGSQEQGGTTGNADHGGSAATATTGAGSSPGQATGKVNVNTATEAELESLPGIGPSTAAKIVADRAANGSFKSIDDLTRVSGIGEKKLASIAGLICV